MIVDIDRSVTFPPTVCNHESKFSSKQPTFSNFQIEYNPCSVPSLCTNLMKEFSSALLGQVGQQVPIYMNRFKDAQFYGPIDTIRQYLTYFVKFRGIGSFGQDQNPLP